jgi:predicted N-acetyltransferase YhbS
VVGQGFGARDLPHEAVILREATSEDEPAFESFDLGAARSPWLDEVAEIVAGLVSWRDDPDHRNLDRQVVVAEVGGEIMAVAAHERVEHERFGPLAEHRYLMVVAVRADYRRSGTARTLTESVFVAMQTDGVRTVRWLVHPRTYPSIAFSRSAFPEADETYPPEDRPYAAFLLAL